MPANHPRVRIIPLTGQPEAPVQIRTWDGPAGPMQLEGTAKALMRAIFLETTGSWPPPQSLPALGWTSTGEITLALAGTRLQMAVWRALATIEPGTTISYADLARFVGWPRAVRAVASAVAANPLPVLLPCHRVIRRDGTFGQYVGGRSRKIHLIERERGGAGALETS